MKLALLTTTLIAASTAAFADGHYSNLFKENTPTGVIETLSDISSPSASDHLALGGAYFFKAIEGSLQTRYQYGLDTLEIAQEMGIPFLRLPTTPNPSPEAFDPAVFETVFTDVLINLAQAHLHLSQISADDDASVALNIADIWLDANSDGQRSPGEGFVEIAQSQIAFSQESSPVKPPVVRFDTADAAWLAAYTQMLSGISELVLATDPTTAVAKAYGGGETMDALNDTSFPSFGFLSGDDRPMFDAIAAVVIAIEGQPDPIRTRAAYAHFQTALQDNRQFWQRLALETDNKLEFIPNGQQTSALPIQFPDGIGDSWQTVLADAQAILDGELLIPHWRLGENAGINMAKLFENPPEIDLIGLFQGYTLAPYAEVGEIATFETLEAFDNITGGNSPFFAFVLN